MRDGLKPYLNRKVRKKSERLAGKVPAALSREIYEFRLEGFLIGTLIIFHFDLQFSYSESLSTIAKKTIFEKKIQLGNGPSVHCWWLIPTVC